MDEPEKRDQDENRNEPDPPITYYADIYADQRMIDAVQGSTIAELVKNLHDQATEIAAATYYAHISADQPGVRGKKRPRPVRGGSIAELEQNLLDRATEIEAGAAIALARPPSPDRPISTPRHPKPAYVPRHRPRHTSSRTSRRRSGR
jgi:hypothetical protein